MSIAVVETITDLGVPGLAGAAVGALISHYAAKARGREEHERTVDLLVTQDERRTAQAILDSVREIKNAINTGEMRYGRLHNQWSDQILAPARLIRSEELNGRAKAGLYVVFLATLEKEGDFLSYPLLRGALDVEEWLEAWLRREDPPPAHLPAMDEIRALVRSGERGRIDTEPLEDLLAKRA